MPKTIIDNFIGISSKLRNAGLGYFNEDTFDINPFRKRGYLVPGYGVGTQVLSSGNILAGLILDATADPDNYQTAYAIDDGKLYKITSAGTVFTNDASFPHAVTNGLEVVYFVINGTRRLLYILNANIGLYDGSVTFDDDWLSTVPSGGATLTTGVPHPKLLWNTYLWVGNGQKLSKLDGTSTGTWTPAALDLGNEWIITSLFPTQNYIGICAKRKPDSTFQYNPNDSAVFFWNGTDPTFNYKTPIRASDIISSYNFNGEVYMVTYDNDIYNLERLTNEGSNRVRRLKMFGFNTIFLRNCMTHFDNHLIIGGQRAAYGHSIFSYGSEDESIPKAFNQIADTGEGVPASTGFVKNIFGTLFASSSGTSPTAYRWTKFDTTTYSTAAFRHSYIDYGQKIRINSIRYYFNPLVSGDSVTPTIETDYGTSNTLRDPRGNTAISYTNDGGAITSKKFNVGIDCHAYRPILIYTAGGTAFSKIVIDWDFLPDDN